MKPLVAPAAAVLLGGAGLVCLYSRQVLRLVGLCLGFSAVFSMALHNWIYGHVFVLFSGNFDNPLVLVMPPAAWASAMQDVLNLNFTGGHLFRALRQIPDWLSGPAESYATVPLNAAAVAVLVYVVVRGRQFDPWLRLIGAAALAQHAVAFFYIGTVARYHFLTWFLTALVVLVWFHQVGMLWLRRRYPDLSNRFAALTMAQAACIRLGGAAKDDRMSKKPVGLAHGLTNYGDPDFSRYLRRSFAQSMGYSRGMLDKPVVGIAYTPSGFNNCHRHFPELLAAVKRGVLAAGALPIEFPTVSLGEVFLSPTSMKFRNLMSIDTEEMVRAQPMDAVVLMGGCDKTVPAQLMGAVSAGRPAIMLVAGPMMTGRYRGERLGACTDCRRFWAQYRAGTIKDEEITDIEGRLAVTAGTCAVMGTASTMACIAEALGMILPAPRLSPPCTPTACAPPKQPAPPRSSSSARASRLSASSMSARLRTHCACCWRLAARPMR